LRLHNGSKGKIKDTIINCLSTEQSTNSSEFVVKVINLSPELFLSETQINTFVKRGIMAHHLFPMVLKNPLFTSALKKLIEKKVVMENVSTRYDRNARSNIAMVSYKLNKSD